MAISHPGGRAILRAAGFSARVASRGRHQNQKTQGRGGRDYPARGFSPALEESVGCG